MRVEYYEAKKPTPQDIKFPVLARGLELRDELIVLFISSTCGIRVIGEGKNPIFSAGWIPVENRKHWEILPVGSTVTFIQD